MKNTFGNNVTVTLFGESRGSAVGVVLDGLPGGIPVDKKNMEKRLFLRRGEESLSTKRRESDLFSVVSGEKDGFTTGAPLTVLIENKDGKPDERDVFVCRPSHADYTADCRYSGWQDKEGGGHFSGRLTAALVAGACIAEAALARRHITVSSHILSVGHIQDRIFSDNYMAECKQMKDSLFPVLDASAADKMRAWIAETAKEKNSVGGQIETIAATLPAGVGEPFFDTVESMLSHAIFSVPAVKGIAFGDGFELTYHKGSETNDALYADGKNVFSHTNHMGGIDGGLTNGMPVRFVTAVKPTPSIGILQDSISLADMTNRSVISTGRNDPAIVARIAPVINAVTELTLLDLLVSRFGTGYFTDCPCES